jgi:hypothetical protein
METYWCCEKISIEIWINNGIDFSPALNPSIKFEYDRWKNGDCKDM